MFSILYSFTFSLLLNLDHGIGQMFIFAFSLHHQIPFSNSLITLQDTIFQNVALSVVEFTHVLSNKLLEITIISTLVISTFSDKVKDYIHRKFLKDHSNYG